MNFDVVDEVIRVTDKECFVMARDLVRQEGVLCGRCEPASRWSSTLNRLARRCVSLRICRTLLVIYLST